MEAKKNAGTRPASIRFCRGSGPCGTGRRQRGLASHRPRQVPHGHHIRPTTKGVESHRSGILTQEPPDVNTCILSLILRCTARKDGCASQGVPPSEDPSLLHARQRLNPGRELGLAAVGRMSDVEGLDAQAVQSALRDSADRDGLRRWELLYEKLKDFETSQDF